jgi:hypothetical protein
MQDPTVRRRRSQFLRYDWDAIIGIVAAGAALVLHLLNVVHTDVLLAITLLVLALLLFRDLRREAQDEALVEQSAHNAIAIEAIVRGLREPDVILLGPRQLRPASVSFARGAHGEMIWFNVCLLMFKPQSLFDALLRPALENPNVTGVQFVLDDSERERWIEEVVPKARETGHIEKLRDPRWVSLKQEAVSFILADTAEGTTEAHLSFWGEPFMSRQAGFDIPRYVFHVQSHSELVARLVEMERQSRRMA